jgi:hypothetical protein
MLFSTRFVIALSILLVGTASHATVVFSPAYTYDTSSVETNGSTSKTKRTSLDLRLGYLDKSGLYLGGIYVMENASSTGGADTKMSAVGPSLGFNAQNGFFVIFSYFLTAEHKVSGGSTYTDGMGPQIDLGWVFPLTESFYLGPQLSYRSISYSTIETNGSSVSQDTTRQNTVPYITLWYKF